MVDLVDTNVAVLVDGRNVVVDVVGTNIVVLVDG